MRLFEKTTENRTSTRDASMQPIPSGILALSLGIVCAPCALSVLRRHQVLDLPNDRSSHVLATPRGGGIAPAFAATVAILLSSQMIGSSRVGLLVTALGMGVIGLTDDVRGLKPLSRLLAQFGVALMALFWLERSLTGPSPWMIIFGLCVVVWIVSFVNIFNFMDGINGISVVQVVVAGGAWWTLGHSQHRAALATAGLVVAAVGLAFAPFNVPRARMFLGDAGSYFFGGWLAATAVIGLRANLPPEAILAPLIIYGTDTSLTLLRRILRHEVWYQPHRGHAYQRLVDAGWSHSRASLVTGALIASCSLLGSLSLTGLLTRILGDLAMAGIVAGYVTLPSLLEGRNQNVEPNPLLRPVPVRT
jgi:UDP-GlcNAc:undecaprenyl-phosphate GlcNAc-1-phosphate transferase